MTHLTSFLLLLFLAYGYTDVIVKEDTVTFQREDTGRYWPLPDNNNPGILMVHGRHCYDIMVGTANKTGEMTKMHREHCRGLLSNIIHLFDTNPTYRVDQWICESLTGQKWQNPDNGFDYGLKYADSAHKAQNLMAPDNGLDYGIKYADARSNQIKDQVKSQDLMSRDAGFGWGFKYNDQKKQATKQNLLAPDNGLDYGIKYADAKQKPMTQNLLAPNNGLNYGIKYQNADQKPQNLMAPDNGLDYGIKYQNADQKPQNLMAPGNGLDYGIKYDNQKKQATTLNLLAPDNGLDYGIKYADDSHRDLVKPKDLMSRDAAFDWDFWYDDQKKQATKQDGDRYETWFQVSNGRNIAPGVIKGELQDNTIVKLMADNFGALLMKNYTNPESISKSESLYLNQWKSEAAVKMGAVGLYCHVKGNIEAIREVANSE